MATSTTKTTTTTKLTAARRAPPTPYCSRTSTPTPPPPPSTPVTSPASKPIRGATVLTLESSPSPSPPPSPLPSPPLTAVPLRPAQDLHERENGSEVEGEDFLHMKKAKPKKRQQKKRRDPDASQKPELDPKARSKSRSKPKPEPNPPRGRALLRRPYPSHLNDATTTSSSSQNLLTTLLTHRTDLNSWPYPPPTFPPTPIDTESLTVRLDSITTSLNTTQAYLAQQKQDILLAYARITDAEALANPDLIKRTAEVMEAMALLREVVRLCGVWRGRVRGLRAVEGVRAEVERCKGLVERAWEVVGGGKSSGERSVVVRARGMFRGSVRRLEGELRAGVRAVEGRVGELRACSRGEGVGLAVEEGGWWDNEIEALKDGVERWVEEAGRCVEWHELRPERDAGVGQEAMLPKKEHEPSANGAFSRRGEKSRMPGSWTDSYHGTSSVKVIEETSDPEKPGLPAPEAGDPSETESARRAAIVQAYIHRWAVPLGRIEGGMVV